MTSPGLMKKGGFKIPRATGSSTACQWGHVWYPLNLSRAQKLLKRRLSKLCRTGSLWSEFKHIPTFPSSVTPYTADDFQC